MKIYISVGVRPEVIQCDVTDLQSTFDSDDSLISLENLRSICLKRSFLAVSMFTVDESRAISLNANDAMVNFIPNQWNSKSNRLQNRYTSQTILTEENRHKSLNNHQHTSLQSQRGPGEYTAYPQTLSLSLKRSQLLDYSASFSKFRSRYPLFSLRSSGRFSHILCI